MIMIYLIAGISILLVGYILFPTVINLLMRKRFNSKIKKSPYIHLTFDDGPDQLITPQLLALLDRYNAKATFFVTGENVEKHANIMQEISNRNHDIGEHGYSHRHPWRSDPFRYSRDLVSGGRLIRSYLNAQKFFLFRPPYGKFNLITLLYAWFTHKRITFWNMDIKDFQENDTKRLEKIIDQNLSAGSVILLHDARRNGNNNKHITIEVVKYILDQGTKKGFLFSTIGNALIEL